VRIEVAKIEQKPLRGDFSIQNCVMDPGEVESFTVNDCVANYEVYRISEAEIMLKIHYSGSMRLTCTTCLEGYESRLNESFSVLFTSDPVEAEGAVTLEGKDGFVQVLTSDVIDLEQQVLDTIRLNIPMAHQCRQDCRGICPGCGNNLNVGNCDCVADTVDPRWKDLESFLNKKE